ncbi:hypothetical protein EJ07DRAFT_152614 [Lizonia empirigonia]|nr:hypothetical protein EJ07DRAFT_152614 [Lizonia empirigonia]
MSAPEITLPSLLWRRRRNEMSSNTKNSMELARSPTWPAVLPSPRSVHPAACTQPNLYLQLSQILEWEIWNHNQTRAQAYTAQTQRNDMEAEIWRLSQVVSQWEETCRTAHAALDEHRMEHIKLVQELETTSAELHTLQQQAFTACELSSSCDDCTASPEPRFRFVKTEQKGVLTKEASTDCARK